MLLIPSNNKALGTITSDGDYELCDFPRGTHYEPLMTVEAVGNFDGATVTLQRTPPKSSVAITLKDNAGSDVTFTENGAKYVRAGSDKNNPAKLFAKIEGAGASTSIDITVCNPV